MKCRSNCMLIVSLVCIGACGARTTHPQPHVGAPVWWSPGLGLRALDQLPARMQLEWADSLQVVRASDVSQSAVMNDCASYSRLRSLGYEPRDDQSFGVMQNYGAICRTLELLARAKPSTDAPLTHLLAAPDVVWRLPPMLGPKVSPVDVERRTAAAKAGLSWGELDPALAVEEQSDTRVKLSNAGEHTRIELLAAGDFDGDHRQDVLVQATSYGDEGSWAEIGLWLLGQQQAGPLRTLQKLEL